VTPRIEPLSPPYAPDVKAILDKWMPPGSAVEPLLLFRTIARHALLRDRMRPLGSALLGRGSLPVRVRELLILRTCARCRAEYEWGVHVTAFSGAAGLERDVVDGTVLRAPHEVAAASGPDDLVLRFVDELHDAGNVADATWARLVERFDESALIEMLAVVGFYHLISFVANGARVELEPWAERFPGVVTGS
jgi:hypothetical protein